MNEADVEVLKNAIKADIHKFSMVPDLTDEQFAGNVSGVAMRYKLLGLENLTRIKERWFREGLQDRMRLYAHFLGVKGSPALDADRVTVTFSRSLPENLLEISQMVNNLKNTVPDALLLSQIPFVDNVEAATNLLKTQQEEALKAQQAAFGMPQLTQEEEE
jgi:SPP1 family phage portal protein